ncbi:MAG: BamA/TamA family outer membrane protein [Candidatus Latescibacterota bacterium]
MKRLLIPLLLLFPMIGTGTVHAQYFGQNKVNYTSFDWKYIPTKNFDIYYSEGGYETALIAARFAESSFASLSAHWGYSPRKRIPILVYNSHNDFAQTNVLTEIIEEGVGGFTELFKNRVVIPWEGSLDKFEHVIHHELTHALMFDMLYGGVMESIVGREYTFQLPLWFAEGLAEHESQYWSAEADMIVRDGIISGYLPPLEYIYGGYLVYKGGESFFKFLQEQYGGPNKWIAGELLQNLARTKNVDKTFRAIIGKSVEDLSKEWHRKLRTEHWPEVAGRELPEDFAVKLTDHEEIKNYLNISPAFNPTGDKIAFLSDRNGYKEILLMRAADGKIIQTLVQGEKAGDYEEMHWLRSAITWSPDAKMIAFSTKSGERDAINIIKVEEGGFEKVIKPDMDAVYSPAWSPDGTRILFCGIENSKLDLFTVDVKTGEIVRLTNDYFNESDPSWSPDGKRIAFSSDRRDIPYELTLDDVTDTYDIFTMNADGSDIRRFSAGPYNDRSPFWSPDSKHIVFVSDRNGINNLYAASLDDMTVMPLTNLLTGASSPSWSPDGNNIAFTCFKDGGWDVYVLKRPLKREIKAESVTPTSWRSQTLKLPAADKPKSEVILKDSGSGQELALERSQSKPYGIKFTPDMVNAFASYNTFYGVGGLGQVVFSDIMGDHRIGLGAQLVYSLEESDLDFTYLYLKRRTNLGVNLYHYKNYFYASDWSIFGDRIYGGSLLASRPFNRFKRLDLALNYMALERDRYRFYGYTYGYGDYDYPMTSKGEKLEGVRAVTLETNLVHDNALWEYTGPVNGSRYKLNLEYSPSLSQSDLSYTTVEVDYRKYNRIGRRYSFITRLSGGASFGRDPRMFFLGGDQGWLNAKVAWLGPEIETSRDIYFARSAYPLRGFRWNEFYGRRYFLTNFEFRFPFIDYLLIGWPLQFALGNIGGVFFTDIGSAWGKNDLLRVDPEYGPIVVYNDTFHGGGQGEGGGFALDDIKMSFGVGMRMNLGFAVLRFDTAWRTNLEDTEPSPMFSISMGPDF